MERDSTTSQTDSMELYEWSDELRPDEVVRLQAEARQHKQDLFPGMKWELKVLPLVCQK